MSLRPLTGLAHRLFHPGPTREPTPLPASGRAGRNLPAAITTSIVLIALVVGSLLVSPVAFVTLVGILCLLALWELAGALARKGITVMLAPAYVGAVGMIVCAYSLGAEALVMALYLTVFVTIVWHLLAAPGTSSLIDVFATIFVAVYVPFLASFVVLMVRNAEDWWPLLFYVAVTISNDIGGYCAGVLLGKHPMAPRISPHKSWEGFAGSLVMCVAVGVGGMALLGAGWWWGVAAGIGAAVAGTVGDLTESLIKRDVGLKDMSKLLPGHGGVMDRVDSLLMTAPVICLVLTAALGW